MRTAPRCAVSTGSLSQDPSPRLPGPPLGTHEAGPAGTPRACVGESADAQTHRFSNATRIKALFAVFIV